MKVAALMMMLVSAEAKPTIQLLHDKAGGLGQRVTLEATRDTEWSDPGANCFDAAQKKFLPVEVTGIREADAKHSAEPFGDRKSTMTYLPSDIELRMTLTGSFTITYTCAGATPVYRQVVIQDTTAPTLTMKSDCKGFRHLFRSSESGCGQYQLVPSPDFLTCGLNDVMITQEAGFLYQDPGASATDDLDGDISNQVVASGLGEVDTFKPFRHQPTCSLVRTFSKEGCGGQSCPGEYWITQDVARPSDSFSNEDTWWEEHKDNIMGFAPKKMPWWAHLMKYYRQHQGPGSSTVVVKHPKCLSIKPFALRKKVTCTDGDDVDLPSDGRWPTPGSKSQNDDWYQFGFNILPHQISNQQEGKYVILYKVADDRRRRLPGQGNRDDTKNVAVVGWEFVGGAVRDRLLGGGLEAFVKRNAWQNKSWPFIAKGLSVLSDNFGAPIYSSQNFDRVPFCTYSPPYIDGKGSCSEYVRPCPNTDGLTQEVFSTPYDSADDPDHLRRVAIPLNTRTIIVKDTLPPVITLFDGPDRIVAGECLVGTVCTPCVDTKRGLNNQVNPASVGAESPLSHFFPSVDTSGIEWRLDKKTNPARDIDPGTRGTVKRANPFLQTDWTNPLEPLSYAPPPDKVTGNTFPTNAEPFRGYLHNSYTGRNFEQPSGEKLEACPTHTKICRASLDTTLANCPFPVAKAWDFLEGTTQVTTRVFLISSAAESKGVPRQVENVDFVVPSKYMFIYDAMDESGNRAKQARWMLTLT